MPMPSSPTPPPPDSRLERELRDAHTRLEAIQSATEVGTWTWDPNRDVVHADANVLRIFAFPNRPEGIPLTEFMARMHPDDASVVAAAVQRAIDDPAAAYNPEYRIVAPDGTVRWLNAVGRFHRENGVPVLMSGVLIDITRRKQAELERDQLLAREHAARLEADALVDRLHFSLDALNVGDWHWDAATDIMTVSERTAALYGIPAGSDATRETLRSAIHPEDRERAREAARIATETRADYRIEYRVNHPTRGLRWLAVAGRPVFNPDGSLLGFMGVSQDITERRAQEQSILELSRRLRTQAAHFNETLSHLSDFVYAFDLDGRFIFANRPLLDLLGLAASGIAGKNFHDLAYPEPLASRLQAQIAQVIATREPVTDETAYTSPSGKPGYYEYIFSPVFDEQGNVTSVAGTTRVTTERKQAELALAEARETLQHHTEHLEATVAERTARLQETIGELEAFSYSVSHDMRAPLRAMQGYADALLADHVAQLDPAARRYLDRIRHNAERLELLVRDILTYSRVAKADIALAPIALHPFLENLLAQHPELQPPHARICFADSLPVVRAHEACLSQIFTNLLGNAAKFVSPGVDPRIEITVEPAPDEQVKVVVADNGLGIAPEHFGRIWNIFGRVYPDKAYEGTGIGLSIVKKAVQRMGGSVGLDSTPGQGSRFWFTVPRA